MTIKDKLLIGIVELGRVDNAKQLRVYAATDEHHITHVLWRMQKQGLITFHETGASVLTKIKATNKGIVAYEVMRHYAKNGALNVEAN